MVAGLSRDVGGVFELVTHLAFGVNSTRAVFWLCCFHGFVSWFVFRWVGVDDCRRYDHYYCYEVLYYYVYGNVFWGGLFCFLGVGLLFLFLVVLFGLWLLVFVMGLGVLVFLVFFLLVEFLGMGVAAAGLMFGVFMVVLSMSCMYFRVSGSRPVSILLVA